MKKLLLSTFFLLFLHHYSRAQNKDWVYDGISIVDTTTFTFGTGDTLAHSMLDASIDTSGAMLWRIGNTQKTFFDTSQGIMTDTIAAYPVSANDWFVLKLRNAFNIIISFRHKYQMDSTRDGGIVEFSPDSGKAWYNIKGECNADPDSKASSFGVGLRTDNFYGYTDTLLTGEQAFTGTSKGWTTSRFQFFQGLPIKTTATTGPDCNPNTIYVRFRFVSDTIADNLDGWIIGNIFIRKDYFGGGISAVRNAQLAIYPNPSGTGIINFPALRDEESYTIQITNTIGQTVRCSKYRRRLNLSELPKGMYYYKVSNTDIDYKGRILLE